ncbi:MAG: hypothetical protein MJ211_04025 [Bacteroidales bacterium]|nr:hypothetical protein [Bacteroidales bacterium]
MATINKIKYLTIFFIIALILSGITAFPIETELNFLCNIFDIQNISENPNLNIKAWILIANNGFSDINIKYPFIAYGYDWLAYAHIMIAFLFAGTLKNPVKNKLVFYWGLVCCASIIPLALICGYIREIPFYWQIIDCSFGIFGSIPLFICLKWIKEIEQK